LNKIDEMYAPPFGCVILAFHQAKPVGCIGIRKSTTAIGEIKRMYVFPDFRRKNIGFKLLKLILEKAKELKYKKVRLDTLKSMKSAVKLYRFFGFYEI